MKKLAAAGLLLLASGCSHAIGGIITSDERKIWVITTAGGNQEVYRCADVAPADQPPAPVCKHAPLDPNP